MYTKYLGNILVLRTAQGDFVSAGRCIAYCDAPSVTVEDAKGERHHWRADLAEVVTADREIAGSPLPNTAGVIPVDV